MEPLLVHLQIPFTRECLLAMVTHMGLLFSLRIWRIVIKVIGVEHQSLACPLPLLGQLTFSLPSGTLASLVLEPNADGFTRNLFKHIIQMGIKKIYITQRACLEKPLLPPLWLWHFVLFSVCFHEWCLPQAVANFFFTIYLHTAAHHQYLAELLPFGSLGIRIPVKPILEDENLPMKSWLYCCCSSAPHPPWTVSFPARQAAADVVVEQMFSHPPPRHRYSIPSSVKENMTK